MTMYMYVLNLERSQYCEMDPFLNNVLWSIWCAEQVDISFTWTYVSIIQFCPK